MIGNLNIPMLRRYLRRMVLGRSGLLDAASHTLTIGEINRIRIPAAIFPEGSFEEIVAFSPWRNIETDTLLAKGGDWVCNPTICYTINNVSIANGFVYKNGASQNFGSCKEQIFSEHFRQKDSIDIANLVSTWSGNNFFGSLLLDDYSLELLSSNGGENLRVTGKRYSHDAGYRHLLGITNSRLTNFANVRQLTVYDDPTNSANKAERYRALRATLKSNLSNVDSMPRKLVYLKRGNDGDQRELHNVDQLEDFLRKSEFDIVDTARLTPTEIATRTLDAKIVLGVEGSHLSHGIFSISDSGTLLVIQPPDRFAMVYKEFTDCMGMSFAFVVADPVGPGQFEIDISKLQKLIESIIALHGY